MRILYAGDSTVGGPANYLLGLLRFLGARTVHIPPAHTLHPKVFRQRFDAIILSDFSARRAPLATQRAVSTQVADGTGLLMVGGWGSFAGPCGGWRHSHIEALLPVRCRARDDRRQFPGGALVQRTRPHRLTQLFAQAGAPVIVGLNHLRPKSNSVTLLTATPIVTHTRRKKMAVALATVQYPLLVLSKHSAIRSAALATDLAPHWCGGWVDWGRRRVQLAVTRSQQVEVGNWYVQFVAALIRWLARKER